MTRSSALPGRSLVSKACRLLAISAILAAVFGVASAGARSTISLSCIPSSLVVGQSSSCVVIVGSTSGTPTGNVLFGTAGYLKLGSQECTLIPGSQPPGNDAFCIMRVTATVGGSQKILAGYPDSTGELQVVETTVKVAGGSIVGFCTPELVAVSDTVTCEALVPDTASIAGHPSGKVRFSAETRGVPIGSSGSIEPECVLVPEEVGSRCAVNYIPSRVGDHAVIASYAGDSTHPANNGAAFLQVSARHETSTQLECAPSRPVVATVIDCTTTVTNLHALGGAPTGTVLFDTLNLPVGTFPGPNGCELKPVAEKVGVSICHVLYKPVVVGGQTLRGTFQANLSFEPSEGVAHLEVVSGP